VYNPIHGPVSLHACMHARLRPYTNKNCGYSVGPLAKRTGKLSIIEH